MSDQHEKKRQWIHTSGTPTVGKKTLLAGKLEHSPGYLWKVIEFGYLLPPRPAQKVS